MCWVCVHICMLNMYTHIYVYWLCVHIHQNVFMNTYTHMHMQLLTLESISESYIYT